MKAYKKEEEKKTREETQLVENIRLFTPFLTGWKKVGKMSKFIVSLFRDCRLGFFFCESSTKIR